MLVNKKFKIKKNKKNFVLFLYNQDKLYTIPFPFFVNNKIYNFYYIILFLIKFGLIDVYI